MHITISAFFSGTGHKVSNTKTLVHLLNTYIDTNAEQKAMSFDGCGVTHGIRGVIFGTGLDEQCQEVIEQVAAEIEKGNTVSLNVYGHSRGAIGALMLAKQLSDVDPELLDINLALLDPVPGNLITTSTLDFFDISLAKKTMDLRECKPLKKLLALYPNEPLPTLAVHAPLFSLYPKHTVVEEDVIAGCHAGAQFQSFASEEQVVFTRHSFISFARFFQFFKDCGSQFKPLPALEVDLESHSAGLANLKVQPDQLDDALLSVYASKNAAYHDKTDRYCHSAKGIHIKTKDRADYFNLHHQRLAGMPEDKSTALATIEENSGPISLLKREILHNPNAWQAIKWSLLSVGVTILVLSVVGLAAIPPIVAAVLVGPAVAALWYEVVKPLSQWAINRFFYPMYHVREIPSNNESIFGSSKTLVTSLGVTQAGSRSPLPKDLTNQVAPVTEEPSYTAIPDPDLANLTLGYQ